MSRAGRSRVVPRWNAGSLVVLMAVAFGITVVVTRLYLMVTGYPKIGGGTYHIAHALFGGLLLVIASVVMLMYANRTAATVGAVLSGVGLGLFIDEVGKFITANNNYFFPLAAPIIYFAFLLMVLVARRARRVRATGPETDLLSAVDGLPLLVAQRMTDDDRAAMRARLTSAMESEAPEHVELARVLHDYLHAHESMPQRPSHAAPIVAGLRRFENAVFPRPVLRVILIVVLGAHVLWSAGRLLLATVVALGWHSYLGPLQSLIDRPDVDGLRRLVVFGTAIAAEAVTLVLYAVGTGEFVRGDDPRAVRIATWATVLSLTVVNVLISYFHQFATVFGAVAEALLLFALWRYRVRFLMPRGPGKMGE